MTKPTAELQAARPELLEMIARFEGVCLMDQTEIMRSYANLRDMLAYQRYVEHVLDFWANEVAGLRYGVAVETRRICIADEARRRGSLEAVKAHFDDMVAEFRLTMNPALREEHEMNIEKWSGLLADAMAVLETQL